MSFTSPDALPSAPNPAMASADVSMFTNMDPETRDDSEDPWRFESLTGSFLFNEPTAELSSPLTVHGFGSKFGLLDDGEEAWEGVKRRVSELQASAPPNVKYKLLFCGRHAQGWHNVASEKYPQALWDGDYAKRTTDGEIVWGPDAELTPLGQQQAITLHEAWKSNLAAGCPKPEKWLCSPFTRTADTMRLSFGEVLKGEKPVFVEGLREIFGEQTCDQRRSKSYLAERFPDYEFEAGFAEEDPLWKPDERELEVNRRVRVREQLYRIFDECDETYISITSHACSTLSLCAVLRHRIFKLGTSGMIPIIVKATRNTGAAA
ncbi:histidine phosphatase superfamily [Filobasidium floriforme]|uniref:histidine phosphatase superfamily n=1 Tax=Filobasidium floriforme TaxID=5210 RepID=UPI001E8EBBAF|nr:histidine phosphatase superfamily [Filobasidium floriforme]KAH8080188.1 histidine phosphatase superfamily [Filobasidium floriforme]